MMNASNKYVGHILFYFLQTWHPLRAAWNIHYRHIDVTEVGCYGYLQVRSIIGRVALMLSWLRNFLSLFVEKRKTIAHLTD